MAVHSQCLGTLLQKRSTLSEFALVSTRQTIRGLRVLIRQKTLEEVSPVEIPLQFHHKILAVFMKEIVRKRSKLDSLKKCETQEEIRQ